MKNKRKPSSKQKQLSDFAAFAVENMSDGALLISKDASIVYVNRAACEQLGYTEEELLGMRIMDINPHVTQEIWDSVWGVTVSDKFQVIETEHLTKDGRIVPVEVLANYFELDGEEYSCSFTRDITGRRISEDALKKETLRRKILMDRSLDGIAIINQEHEVVEANQRFAAMLGYAPEEIIGLHTWEWEASMTEEEIRNNFADLTKTNAVFETRHRRKDGTIVDVEVSASGAKVGDEPMVFTITRDITERKKEEEKLKQSLSLLRAALESTADGIFVVSNDRRITDFNEQFVKLWRIPQNILDWHNDQKALAFVLDQLENPEQFMAKVMELYAEPEATSFDILAFKDGRIFERYSQSQRVDGKPVGRVWSFRDVTELRRAAEKIRELNTDLSATLSAIPDLLFELDQNGTYLNIWTKNQELLAREKEILLGHTVTEMLAPDAAETVMAALSEAQRNGQSFGGVMRLDLPNGARWFELSTSKKTVTNTSVNQFIMLSRDITERKLAEEALLVSEEKYRLVVENANDAILIVQDRMIKFSNHQLTALTGYSEEELTKVPFDHFLHADDKEMVLNTHRKRLQGEDVPVAYSFRIVNKLGESKWVQVSAVLITWEGRPASLSFLRDITYQKKLEEQLFQSHKMEAIGTLAGGIAHDFNNLLMGILGYTSLMLLKIDKTHLFYEKLKTIEGLVESGSDLTKQLLGFARGGKYEVKPVDMNGLIIKTSEIFERTKKEITIYKKLQEDLQAVEADAGQIEQVLMNLYVNAWQAMPSGGKLYLETQNVELEILQSSTFNVNPGKYVKISVTDTGFGMDIETQKRIFEPFFTTKAIGKGTGLGLASAYGIIKNHGGIINVHSKRGHGTTFTLYLPASGSKTAVAKPLQGGLLTGNETILTVDDEQANIETIKELLEMLGYKVLTAQSGKKAIELYKEHPGKIQLVILDMIMPEMNGKDTLVRLMDIDKNVSVLLSSGYSINGEAKSILDLGCKGFIQKPFRIEELSRKIREVLKSRAP
jgi:two-component system, cell cycle sensor histidine kinase and response regulator CckA